MVTSLLSPLDYFCRTFLRRWPVLVLLFSGCTWDRSQIPYMGQEQVKSTSLSWTPADDQWVRDHLNPKERGRMDPQDSRWREDHSVKGPADLKRSAEETAPKQPPFYRVLDAQNRPLEEKLIGPAYQQLCPWTGERTFAVSYLGFKVGLMALGCQVEEGRGHYKLEVAPTVKVHGVKEFHLWAHSWVEGSPIRPWKFSLLQTTGQDQRQEQIQLFAPGGQQGVQLRLQSKIKRGSQRFYQAKEFIPRLYQDPLSAVFFISRSLPLVQAIDQKRGGERGGDGPGPYPLIFSIALKDQVWVFQGRLEGEEEVNHRPTWRLQASVHKAHNPGSSVQLTLWMEKNPPHALMQFSGKLPMGEVKGQWDPSLRLSSEK